MNNIIRYPSRKRKRRRVKPPAGVDPRQKIDIFLDDSDLVGINLVVSLAAAVDVLALLNEKYIEVVA